MKEYHYNAMMVLADGRIIYSTLKELTFIRSIIRRNDIWITAF